jgi:hypothetical protein
VRMGELPRGEAVAESVEISGDVLGMISAIITMAALHRLCHGSGGGPANGGRFT